MALQWGIVGAGRISHDFVTAVQTLPQTNHTIVSVAGRNKVNVEKFAKEHNIPKWYDDYLNLAKDAEVLLKNFRNRLCGKPKPTTLYVLCEKPFTMNEKHTSTLIKMAKERNLFLMEAVWSRCFPAYKKMKELIDEGAIGDVLYASAHFGQPIQHMERLSIKDLGGGAILDLGVYLLQFQQFVFRDLKPIKIAINGHKSDKYGTEESAAAIITYPEGKMAVVSTSTRVLLPNEALVVGTKGSLRLPVFWCPTTLITPDRTYEWPLPESDVPYVYINSAGLYYEAEEARQCIKKGQIESPHITHNESIQLAHLMDLIRKEIGVVSTDTEE